MASELFHTHLPHQHATAATHSPAGHDALEALKDAQDADKAENARADAASLARTRIQGLLETLPFATDEPTRTAATVALAACARTDLLEAKQSLVSLYEQGGALAGQILPLDRPSDLVEDYLAPEASIAKQHLTAAEEKRKKAQQALDDANKVLGADAGPGGAFHVLRDRCFSLKVAQYNYEVCAFGRAKQDHTSLGNFREWRSEKREWYFGGGAHCPGRGARDLVVSLVCGADERLANLGEPDTCSYTADLYTPAACIP